MRQGPCMPPTLLRTFPIRKMWCQSMVPPPVLLTANVWRHILEPHAVGPHCFTCGAHQAKMQNHACMQAQCKCVCKRRLQGCTLDTSGGSMHPRISCGCHAAAPSTDTRSGLAVGLDLVLEALARAEGRHHRGGNLQHLLRARVARPPCRPMPRQEGAKAAAAPAAVSLMPSYARAASIIKKSLGSGLGQG